MGGKRIDDEAREAIYRDYKLGMTRLEIASKHCVACRSVNTIVRERAMMHGEKLKSPHSNISQYEIDKRNALIDELYKARYSNDEIAEKVGCTKGTVTYYLRKKYGNAKRAKEMEPREKIYGHVAPFLKSVETPRVGDLTVEKVMHFRDSTKVGEIIKIRDYSVVIHKGTMHRTYKFRNLSCRVIQKYRYVVITTAGTFPWKMCTIM